MAGRFLIQKFSSHMCRSKSLFSATARAGAPALEGSIGDLSNLSHGATVHHASSVPNNTGIHGCAARHFNTFPCSRDAAKTNYSTTSVPIFVDSFGGAKRSFSATSSTRHEISRNAKMAAWATEWDAKSAARQARRAAWEAEIDKKNADFNKFIRNQLCLWCFAGSCSIVGALFEEKSGTSLSNSQSGSHCSSSSCNGQCNTLQLKFVQRPM